MIDQRRQNTIDSIVRHACDVFRGVCAPSESKDFLLAMLLLKFISDLDQKHLGQSDKSIASMCFVVPADTDFYSLHAARLQSSNGLRLNKAFHEIEKANDELLQGVFHNINFDAMVLGSTEQKDRVLRQLLEAFNTAALDFRADQENLEEAFAYACDSIIRYVAEISGRRGGMFLTPPEISLLLARLMQPKEGDTICDPCCGSGSLLITCSQQMRKSSDRGRGVLYGQEKDGSIWGLAKMNMILHGETQHQLEWGDTLRAPKLLSADGSLMKFDIVVSSPPFSLRDWGHDEAERDIHRRYWRGVPPRAAGDYAFISHMVETLKPKTGRMAAVVSLGVLFRGGGERQIRKHLLQENLIDAVIALPAKMFSNTGIQVAILVVRQNKTDDSVLFIDASRSYQHGKTQNVLCQADLNLIESTCHTRHDKRNYARLVTQAEIAANDYNLSVARYVDTIEDEEEVDLMALRTERGLLQAELAGLEAKLASLLQEINNA
jgi:type I restriction enzyme M protein